MFKKPFLPFLLILPLLLPLLFPVSASAQTKPWDHPDFVNAGIKCVEGSGPDAVATIQGLECLVANMLNIAITLIGVGVFAMILFGAFQYLTSQGDPKAAEAGKQTITYAIIGLVLAISAWFILNLISGFTGLPQILQFNTQI